MRRVRFNYVSVEIEFAVQPWMNAGQVVTLEIVVDISLLVALHVVSATFKQFHPGKIKLLCLPRQFAQAIAQRRRRGIQIHKDEVEPFLNFHRHQSKIFGPEILDALDIGGADEPAIQAIGPAVIAAAEDFARAASFRRRPGSVAAHVVEAAELSIVAAHDQQRLTYQLSREIVARIRHLIFVSHNLPTAGEYLFFLVIECSGVGIKLGGQRPCPATSESISAESSRPSAGFTETSIKSLVVLCGNLWPRVQDFLGPSLERP